MFRKLKSLIRKLYVLDMISSKIESLENKIDILNTTLGRLYSLTNNDNTSNTINDYEFKVYSQWGDDGIIQFLISKIEIKNKVFVEFGVEDYSEANTRFLLINNNWKGLVIDSSYSNIEKIQNSNLYWKYDITAIHSFVTVDNINDLLINNGMNGEIGLLHIDIDGNDYWVWEAISVIDPIIVIMEYNSIFGDNRAITIPYKPNFDRTNEHYSNLYFGASLLALSDLAEKKGYIFVGCNSNGNNAYFVKHNYIGSIQSANPKSDYVKSRARESRDKQGDLTFISGDERLQIIKGMPVYNIKTNKTEVL